MDYGGMIQHSGVDKQENYPPGHSNTTKAKLTTSSI